MVNQNQNSLNFYTCSFSSTFRNTHALCRYRVILHLHFAGLDVLLWQNSTSCDIIRVQCRPILPKARSMQFFYILNNIYVSIHIIIYAIHKYQQFSEPRCTFCSDLQCSRRIRRIFDRSKVSLQRPCARFNIEPRGICRSAPGVLVHCPSR